MPRRMRYRSARPAYRRKRGGGLTGGTGDVNPQWFNMDTAVSLTDSNPIVAAGAHQSYTVPVQQSAMMRPGRNNVMEILKVQFYISGTLGTISSRLRVGLTTRAPSTSGNDLLPTKPHVIAATAFTGVGCLGGTGATAGTQYGCTFDVNLTDEAGHGVIFAGQTIYLGLESDAMSGTNTTPAVTTARCKILFRWKGVTMTEYIGVVTSQLSA